ncbi:uncharacterized protein PAC_01173 [Phialocephala subalpina]|uniref:Uncharacterized protein n=1 Tax=Phialocephala subalpina TaxID=576137 RepID=A0A1L7WEY2_9HELO|nr:uncharacterized protein PAC_01173 [Phialocephala subalpina]
MFANTNYLPVPRRANSLRAHHKADRSDKTLSLNLATVYEGHISKESLMMEIKEIEHEHDNGEIDAVNEGRVFKERHVMMENEYESDNDEINEGNQETEWLLPGESSGEGPGAASSSDHSSYPTPQEFAKVDQSSHEAGCKEKIDYLMPRILNTRTSDPEKTDIVDKAVDFKVFQEDMEHLLVVGVIAAAEAAERVNVDMNLAHKSRMTAKRKAEEDQKRELAYVEYAKDVNRLAVLNAKLRAQFAATVLQYERESYQCMGLADWLKIYLFAYIKVVGNWFLNLFTGSNLPTSVNHDEIFAFPLHDKHKITRRGLDMMDEKIAQRGEMLRRHRATLDLQRGPRGPVIVTTPQQAINEHLREQEQEEGQRVRYSFDGVNVYRA